VDGGGSWGFSRLKNNNTAGPAGDGNDAVRSTSIRTPSPVPPVDESLKLVLEGTEEGSTGPGAEADRHFWRVHAFLLD